MRGQRPNEAFEVGPICRRVGKRIGAGKIFYIGCAEIGRRMVETNITDKAELAGSVCEVGGRHVIAKSIPHPGKLLRSGRDFGLRLEYLLVAVIAGTQHHPVLAEGDRSIIVICRNVSDAQTLALPSHRNGIRRRHCIAADMRLHNMHFLGQI